MRAPPMRAPFAKRLRHVGRIDLGVVRQPQRAEQIVGAHHGIFCRRLGDRNDLAGDALRARRRMNALEQRHALGRARDQHRAALLPAGRLPGLGFELLIELGRILHEPRHVLVRAQLPDQSGRMPGRAAGQPPLLQQHDVAPAVLGQVIGDRAADDAAADDDGARAIGKRMRRHGAGLLQLPANYDNKISQITNFILPR